MTTAVTIKEVVDTPLITSGDGKLVANTQKLEMYLAAVRAYNDNIIENSLSVEEVEMAYKIQKGNFEKIEAYRLGYTREFDTIKDIFTKGIEPKIKAEYKRLEDRKAFLMEAEYQISGDLITQEIEALLMENSKLGMSISMFESFIAKNRTLVGMRPRDDGRLSPASLTKIAVEFEKLSAPIIAKMAREESLIREQKLFENSINSIGIATATTKEDISKCRLKLDELEQSLYELYPNYAVVGKNTIANNKSLLEQKERAIDNEAKRQDEAKNKEAQEIFAQLERDKKAKEDEKHDNDIMQKVKDIDDFFESISDDVELLSNARLELIKYFNAIRLQKNKDTVSSIGQKLKLKIDELEEAEAKKARELEEEQRKERSRLEQIEREERIAQEAKRSSLQKAIDEILAIEDGGEDFEPTFRLIGTKYNDVKKVVNFMKLLEIKFEEIA